MRFHMLRDLVETAAERECLVLSVFSRQEMLDLVRSSPCRDWYQQNLHVLGPSSVVEGTELPGDKLDRELVSSLCTGCHNIYLECLVQNILCLAVGQLVPILPWQDFSLVWKL